MSSPSTVELEGIRKEYDSGVVAVHGVDLSVPAGEFIVLVGPSGCGKSTTLRMVAGLEAITAGTLKIGGRVVNDLPPSDRDIAMVFQSYALYPHMTVRDNMAFALKLRKRPAAEIAEKVNAAAGILGLVPLLDRTPRQLSGGQRQRVAIGRAIVREPSAFLFDEPLSNLDAALRGEMRRELAAIHRRLGATMMYVTHDQVEAMTLGDRIVVMHEGRVRQVDTPANVYNHPLDTFVAAFLGSPPMNLLKGSIVGEAGRAYATLAEAPSVRMELPDELRAHVLASETRDVIVGMRPEHLAVSTDDGTDAVPATVELVEPLGHEQLLHLRTGGATITVRSDPGLRARVGDVVRLRARREKMQLFDAGTGKTLRALSS
ncbi:MAG: ugpC [Gemmatimonadetes bacterium]|nr:ugpC [Gemmatimonadota bacterium]